MKKLFASMLLVLSFNAFAEHREVYALNGENGILTLTNEPCDKKAPEGVKWWAANTEMSDGSIVEGCWLFAVDAPVVIVYWENGFKSVLQNPDAFSTTKPNQKKQEYF